MKEGYMAPLFYIYTLLSVVGSGRSVNASDKRSRVLACFFTLFQNFAPPNSKTAPAAWWVSKLTEANPIAKLRSL